MSSLVYAVAIKSDTVDSIGDVEFLSEVCQSEITVIETLKDEWRQENYVGIRREKGVLWIFSILMPDMIIKNKGAGTLLNKLYEIIGTPELIFALIHNDQVYTVLYSIYEQGQKVREYYFSDYDLLKDFGSQLEPEKVWNNANKLIVEEYGEEQEYFFFDDNPEKRYHKTEIPDINLKNLVNAYFGYTNWESVSELNDPSNHYPVKAWEVSKVATPSHTNTKSSWWKFWK